MYNTMASVGISGIKPLLMSLLTHVHQRVCHDGISNGHYLLIS